MQKSFLAPLTTLVVAILFVVALVALTTYTDLRVLSLEQVPVRTITVTGSADMQQMNQIARFSASVAATGEDKESVNQEMQQTIADITQAALDFGIPQENIQTEFFNIYQEEITDFEGNSPTVKTGPWRGNTNVSFTDVPGDRAEEFASVLVASGATSIDGPSFTVSDYDEMDGELASQAITNAREKAEQMLSSQGLSVGKVISVDETNGSAPVYAMMDRAQGGGGGFNPGSTEISKSVLVTFEIK